MDKSLPRFALFRAEAVGLVIGPSSGQRAISCPQMSKLSSAAGGRVIGLEQAVQEIRSAVEGRDGAGPRAVHSPFFLIVGAGISHPPIPLARDIEALCRQRIVQASPGGRKPPEGGSPFERYAACMEAAFPNAEQRRAFLHEQMRSARLSAANLRLAHLLGAGHLTNLVFTPNFDEMLSQALRFLGYPVIVCDHPAMTGRLDPLRNEIQVIHVHGTHWFYDLRNLTREVRGAAARSSLTSLSLPELLASVLHTRSPLVVGYSGWEGDVLMSSLKRRLKHQLGSNLYWFCFRRSEVEALPTWLKNDPDVRFVAADTSGPGGLALHPAEPSLAGGSNEPVLPARRVFEELILALGLDAPDLSRDPLGFLERYLRQHLDSEDSGEEAADPLLIASTLARVRRAVDREREESRRPGEAAARLEKILDAVRKPDYSAALAAAQELDLDKLEPERRLDLERALEQLYLGTADLRPEIGMAACELRLKLAGKALSKGDEAWNVSHAAALHGKGYALFSLGRREEALLPYEEIITRHRDSPEVALQERVAKALVNKGFILSRLKRRSESLASYEELLQRIGPSEAPALQEQVATALRNKGVVLDELGRQEESLASYEELLQRFGPSEAPALQEQVASALYNKGAVLSDLGRHGESLASYEELLQRFGSSEAPAIQEVVALARSLESILVRQLGKPRKE